MQNRKLIGSLFVASLLSAVAMTTYAADAITPAVPAATSDSGGGVVDDALITSKVKAALVADKQVSALKISVTTKQGVVILSGTVPSAEAGDHAVQTVASIEGVKDVKNELKVKSAS